MARTKPLNGEGLHGVPEGKPQKMRSSRPWHSVCYDEIEHWCRCRPPSSSSTSTPGICLDILLPTTLQYIYISLQKLEILALLAHHNCQSIQPAYRHSGNTLAGSQKSYWPEGEHMDAHICCERERDRERKNRELRRE
jgi:hypothetical protein